MDREVSQRETLLTSMGGGGGLGRGNGPGSTPAYPHVKQSLVEKAGNVCSRESTSSIRDEASVLVHCSFVILGESPLLLHHLLLKKIILL